MNREQLIDEITRAVMQELAAPQPPPQRPACTGTVTPQRPDSGVTPPPSPLQWSDNDAMARMLTTTTARIGVGHAGNRLRTQTLLKLRADHAAARDAVFKDVSAELLEQLGLFSVQTLCTGRNEHLTRPDLGRQLSPEAEQILKSRCKTAPDVQVFVSDGLSSLSIESNLPKLLPVLNDGLAGRGLSVGTPFFVKYGRVAVMEPVAQLLGCSKVVCVLIGERPGLGSAESMSAYLAYAPQPGMMESDRTVISNIYSKGIAAAEAGAYIAEVVQLMLEQKTSGVNLRK